MISSVMVRAAYAQGVRPTMTVQHSGGRLLTFGASFLSFSFVSVKLPLWGYELWSIYILDHPVVYAALILGLLVLPWLAVIARTVEAAVQQAIEEQYGWSFGDEAEEKYGERIDEALEKSFGWLAALEGHPVSAGILTGGTAGVSVSIVKVVLPLAQWLTIAASLGITFLLLYLISAAYWKRAARKMASGLNESLKELYPWMSDRSDDD